MSEATSFRAAFADLLAWFRRGRMAGRERRPRNLAAGSRELPAAAGVPDLGFEGR